MGGNACMHACHQCEHQIALIVNSCVQGCRTHALVSMKTIRPRLISLRSKEPCVDDAEVVFVSAAALLVKGHTLVAQILRIQSASKVSEARRSFISARHQHSTTAPLHLALLLCSPGWQGHMHCISLSYCSPGKVRLAGFGVSVSVRARG